MKQKKVKELLKFLDKKESDYGLNAYTEFNDWRKLLEELEIEEQKKQKELELLELEEYEDDDDDSEILDVDVADFLSDRIGDIKWYTEETRGKKISQVITKLAENAKKGMQSVSGSKRPKATVEAKIRNLYKIYFVYQMLLFKHGVILYIEEDNFEEEFKETKKRKRGRGRPKIAKLKFCFLDEHILKEYHETIEKKV